MHATSITASRPATRHTRVRRRGYILLEMVLALTIFSLAVLGLAKSLNNALEGGNVMNRDAQVRIGLRSFVEEWKRKAISDMTTSVEDPVLGATYTSVVEPLSFVIPHNGMSSQDCYRVKFTATYTSGGQQRDETVELWFYQNQAEQDKRKNR